MRSRSTKEARRCCEVVLGILRRGALTSIASTERKGAFVSVTRRWDFSDWSGDLVIGEIGAR